MHSYSEIDTRRCFRYLAFWGHHNHFVFIGDTRLRDLYQALVDYLRPTDEEGGSSEQKWASKNLNLSEDVTATDLEYVDYKLRLRVNYIHAVELSTVIDKFSVFRADVDPPMAIIASCAYKEFREGNLTTSTLERFKQDLGRLVKPIDDLVARKTKVLWKLLDPIDEDYFDNQQKLVEKQIVLGGEKKLQPLHLERETWKNVRNRDVDKLNRATVDVLEYSDGMLWSSGRLIASGLLSEVQFGFRSSPLALSHNLQILLNMYCNDNMNYNDGTCCSSSEQYTTLQIVTYAILGLW